MRPLPPYPTSIWGTEQIMKFFFPTKCRYAQGTVVAPTSWIPAPAKISCPKQLGYNVPELAQGCHSPGCVSDVCYLL